MSTDTVTIWTLSAQPLPASDIPGAAFVTIWTFVTAGFAIALQLKISKSGKAIWPEFKTIGASTILLSLWYLATAIDRWMHYEQRRMPFGYILFEPIVQGLQLISTLFFLWGTYGVVWNELQRRFASPRSQGLWWFAAKVTFFLVILVTVYFWILRIATAAVWIRFLSLNVISDVATKRNGFEMAMCFFFSVFSLLTAVAVVATVFFRASMLQGSWAKTRIYIVLATVMLLGRSVAECAIAFQIHMSDRRRADLQLPYDIVYGLMTTLYLTLIYLQAWQLTSKLDMDSPDVDKIQSDIRTPILKLLDARTMSKKLEAPPFRSVIAEVRRDLEAILRNPNCLSADSPMAFPLRRQVAEDFISGILQTFGHLGEVQAEEPPAQNQRNNRHRTPPSTVGLQGHDGRASAPPLAQNSSSLFDVLSGRSNPALRNTNSLPDMPHVYVGSQRFAPVRGRAGLGTTSGRHVRDRRNMPDVDEDSEAQDPPSPLHTQRPQRSFAPTFAARAAGGGPREGLPHSDSAYTIPRNFSSPLPGPSSGSDVYASQYNLQVSNRSVSAGHSSSSGHAPGPLPQTRHQATEHRFQAQYSYEYPVELHSSPRVQPTSELNGSTASGDPGPSRWDLSEPSESPPPQPPQHNFDLTNATTSDFGPSQTVSPGPVYQSGNAESPSSTPEPGAQQAPVKRRVLPQSVAQSSALSRTFPAALRPGGAQAPRQRPQPSSIQVQSSRTQLEPLVPQAPRDYTAYQPPPQVQHQGGYAETLPSSEGSPHANPSQLHRGQPQAGQPLSQTQYGQVARRYHDTQHDPSEYELRDLPGGNTDRGGTPNSGWGQ
ncbi:hypothetical protein QBC44DRAFT_140030 [Cladorrhinum sp. PSN332]|nr:hypothetical protein QBC44DRAFT_140030 [Cladorrhinum sp. PSN332]